MPGSRRGRRRSPAAVPTPILVSVEGSREMKELATRLKKLKREDLRKKLRANLKAAGDPAVQAIRGAAMQVKVTRGLDHHSQVWSDTEKRMVRKQGLPGPRETRWGRRSTNLRLRVARATNVSVTQRGIRIKVSAKKVGDYGVTLPRYLDGSMRRWRRWRHPVFFPGSISEAPPNLVVEQHGSPYFFDTIKAHRAAFRKAAFKAIDEIGDELNR